jgi:selenocysteine lyase/cysteine desulfurase
VALNIEGWDSAAVSDELSERYGIATRPGAHCAPLLHKALGTDELGGAVRFSISCFNNTEEIDTAIRAVRELAEE